MHTEATPYTILRAQHLLQQLVSTLMGDQAPLGAEALQLLQAWAHALSAEPIALVDSDLESHSPVGPTGS